MAVYGFPPFIPIVPKQRKPLFMILAVFICPGRQSWLSEPGNIKNQPQNSPESGSTAKFHGWSKGTRTPGTLPPKQARCQLRYAPANSIACYRAWPHKGRRSAAFSFVLLWTRYSIRRSPSAVSCQSERSFPEPWAKFALPPPLPLYRPFSSSQRYLQSAGLSGAFPAR